MTIATLANAKNMVVALHNNTPGDMNVIPEVSPAPSHSSPLSILYLKMLYIVRANGTLSPAYDFDSTSGVYPYTNGTDFTNFLTSIKNNTVDTTKRLQVLPGGPASPPVPVIEDPCYIVYAVDMGGKAQFDTSQSSVTTDDPRVEYFNLRAVTDDGTAATPAHIVYHNAISPSYNGMNNQTGFFNLQFLVMQPDGSVKASTLDPAIKNKGHTG